MKNDQMTIASSDILSAETLKGVILRETATMITLMVRDGNKIDISRKWGIINKGEIDFQDRIKEQDFVLSDWQMKHLYFYTGKRASFDKLKMTSTNSNQGTSFDTKLCFRDIKIAYENAVEFYKEVVSRDVNKKVEMGGFGNVHIEGIMLNKKICRILRAWAEANPKHAHFEPKKGKEENKLTLSFGAPLETKLWRLECFEPRKKATERFVALLASMGYPVIELHVKRNVAKRRKFRRRMQEPPEPEPSP